jgi:predicted nucleic acid-binding protein
VSGFLLDTNVVSELRKADRSNVGVRRWMDAHITDELWLSVLVIGELRRGVELIRRRDVAAATSLESWLDRLLDQYDDRILPVTTRVAERWARITAPDPVPIIDGLLAATAFEHGLVLVTRNVHDLAATGVALHNPFTG